MFIFQGFGPTGGFFNLRDFSTISPADFVLISASPNEIRLSIPKVNITGTLEGNFVFSGQATSFSQISGLISKSTLFLESSLYSIETNKPGYDISRAGNFAYELSLLGGNDVFTGSNTNFTDGDGFQSLGGNDRFKGFGSDASGDQFFGGEGRDTSIYQGKFSDYTIQFSNQIADSRLNDGSKVGGFIVNDKIQRRDGIDYLVEVERLEFEQTDSNGVNRVALDIGPAQNAGSVYMLYKAAFNRAPDEGGMGYWLAQKDGGKNIVTDLAQGFVNSKEFTDKYGANPNNADYVNKLYQNVLGRAGEADGVAYWNKELNEGNRTKAAVLVEFATLPEGAANVASLIANGIEYQEWVG